MESIEGSYAIKVMMTKQYTVLLVMMMTIEVIIELIVESFFLFSTESMDSLSVSSASHSFAGMIQIKIKCLNREPE